MREEVPGRLSYAAWELLYLAFENDSKESFSQVKESLSAILPCK